PGRTRGYWHPRGPDPLLGRHRGYGRPDRRSDAGARAALKAYLVGSGRPCRPRFLFIGRTYAVGVRGRLRTRLISIDWPDLRGGGSGAAKPPPISSLLCRPAKPGDTREKKINYL